MALPMRPSLETALTRLLERFRAKWKPVRVKKTRQNKRVEPRFDSIKTGMALGMRLVTFGTSLNPHGEEPRSLRGVSNHEAACDWSSADLRLPGRKKER
jgi:hypothetical protein